jgi:hypothetical protein
MIYPAKRDLWILVLLLLVSTFLLGGGMLLVGAFFWKRVPLLWAPGLILSSAGSMVLWIALGSGYEIDERDVHLRLGRWRWTLSIDSIVDVYSTSRFHHDFGWGLALSFDRLRIKCRDRWLPFWISPEDKAAFIAELRRANPQVKVTQD